MKCVVNIIRRKSSIPVSRHFSRSNIYTTLLAFRASENISNYINRIIPISSIKNDFYFKTE
jgi:hypothetical protein